MAHSFVDDRAMITTTLSNSYSTLSTLFNNSELSQNRSEKQIMPFKTTVNWLFNDIWRYLGTGYFDWKISETIERVYYIHKGNIKQYSSIGYEGNHLCGENHVSESVRNVVLRWVEHETQKK